MSLSLYLMSASSFLCVMDIFLIKNRELLWKTSFDHHYRLYLSVLFITMIIYWNIIIFYVNKIKAPDSIRTSTYHDQFSVSLGKVSIIWVDHHYDQCWSYLFITVITYRNIIIFHVDYFRSKSNIFPSAIIWQWYQATSILFQRGFCFWSLLSIKDVIFVHNCDNISKYNYFLYSFVISRKMDVRDSPLFSRWNCLKGLIF